MRAACVACCGGASHSQQHQTRDASGLAPRGAVADLRAPAVCGLLQPVADLQGPACQPGLAKLGDLRGGDPGAAGLCLGARRAEGSTKLCPCGRRSPGLRGQLLPECLCATRAPLAASSRCVACLPECYTEVRLRLPTVDPAAAPAEWKVDQKQPDPSANQTSISPDQEHAVCCEVYDDEGELWVETAQGERVSPSLEHEKYPFEHCEMLWHEGALVLHDSSIGLSIFEPPTWDRRFNLNCIVNCAHSCPSGILIRVDELDSEEVPALDTLIRRVAGAWQAEPAGADLVAAHTCRMAVEGYLWPRWQQLYCGISASLSWDQGSRDLFLVLEWGQRSISHRIRQACWTGGDTGNCVQWLPGGVGVGCSAGDGSVVIRF